MYDLYYDLLAMALSFLSSYFTYGGITPTFMFLFMAFSIAASSKKLIMSFSLWDYAYGLVLLIVFAVCFTKLS